MKSFLPTSFLLVSWLLGFFLSLQAQSLPSRITAFRPTIQGQFEPSLETKTSYDEQGRRTYLLEFCWNEDEQKILQRELWIEYKNDGKQSFSRVDSYDKEGDLFQSDWVWFDEQQRPIKDSTWSLVDPENPIYVFRYLYEVNETGQLLKETRELWTSLEPQWAINKEVLYTYDENGCLASETICYTYQYKTNCIAVYFENDENCEIKLTTRIDASQRKDSSNADGSEHYQLTSRWDPSQEWLPATFRIIYYDQWRQNIGYFETNLQDSSQFEFIYLQDSLGNLIYSRTGTRPKDGLWFYQIEYELVEDSETYKAYRKYGQWNINTQDWERRTWNTIDKDTANGTWRYQELDSSLVNGVWAEEISRRRRFHNYYCNGLMESYEDYLGWDDLSLPLERRSYGYQTEDIPCQGTPSPEKLILYPNPTTDFLTFRSPDVLQMAGLPWQVADLSGRVIQRGMFQLDDQACVDVRRLATGHYILYVGEKADHESYRFIKK
ncbi:MAG: T9SS type A sorting domain-containing protein [Bacteroidia bacterium]